MAAVWFRIQTALIYLLFRCLQPIYDKNVTNRKKLNKFNICIITISKQASRAIRIPSCMNSFEVKRLLLNMISSFKNWWATLDISFPTFLSYILKEMRELTIFHIEMLFCFVGCFHCGLFYLCFICCIVLRCALRNVRKDYNIEACLLYKNVAINDLSAILRKLCFAFLKGSWISTNIYNMIFCSIWNDNTQTHTFFLTSTTTFFLSSKDYFRTGLRAAIL